VQAFIGYGRRADPVRSRSFIAQRRTPKLDAIVLLRAGNPNHDDTARLQDSVGGEYAHGHVVQRRRRMPWPPSICHASHLAIPFVPRTAFGRCARRYWTMKRYTRCLIRLVVGMDVPCEAAGSLEALGLADSLPAMLVRA
jgi:hypothetical protein